MLQVKLPVVNRIQPRSNKFATSVLQVSCYRCATGALFTPILFHCKVHMTGLYKRPSIIINFKKLIYSVIII